MEVRTVGIDTLTAADYNPRKDLSPGDPAYDRLEKSLEAFGLVEPLVFNERTGNLVGGHQRLKVLREAGVTQVDVSVVDLDETAERALNLALNRQRGEWDMPKLASLLGELAPNINDIDVTGFEEHEIVTLLGCDDGGDGDDDKFSLFSMAEKRSDGVIFTFGAISVRLSNNLYDAFYERCPDKGLKEFLEGILASSAGIDI